MIDQWVNQWLGQDTLMYYVSSKSWSASVHVALQNPHGFFL